MGSLKTKAQRILTEKNTKLIPENIKAGVTIFDITGTYEGGGKLNIYVQNSEPVNKNGLWLKTDKQISNIISDSSCFATYEENIVREADFSPIPENFGNSRTNGICRIGSVVYIFGCGTNYLHNYKYNIETDTYIRIADCPEDNGSRLTVCKNSNDEIFVIYGDKSKMYKYDKDNDLFISKTWNFTSTDIAGAVCNDIYIYVLFNRNTTFYRYNTVTDVWDTVASYIENLPSNGLACGNGEIFTFQSYSSVCNKYIIKNNSWSRMSSTGFYDTSSNYVEVDTDVFIANYNKIYKFNTLTHKASVILTLPSGGTYGESLVQYGSELLLFSGTKIFVITLKPKEYSDNSIVIAINPNGLQYQTELISTDVNNGLPYNFKNFYYYKDNYFDNTIEKYYGNGTSWVQIT